MPLLSLWKSNPSAVGEFTIDQVVATAGDGNLKDGSVCSTELCTYFAQIPSNKIAIYIEQCLVLGSKLDKSGMVLQDLVNELGRRLDYKVMNGRYQGTVNKIGYDGIWISPEGHTIIAEVKTTDAYQISLNTISGYRQKLLQEETVKGHPSILIIVGRQATGELEAQVRGSRHAWDIRLISMEALIKLVELKENSDELETGLKIRSVLTPMEYTRLDRLVDVMFTTATDVESILLPGIGDGLSADQSQQSQELSSRTWEFTDSTLLQKKREIIIAAMSKHIRAPLVKKSRALYWSSDHSQRVACTISKKYTKGTSYPYWYAYHPQWDEFLTEAAEGYLVLGCMDLPIAFAIPKDEIRAVLEYLNTTTVERGTYWHLHIVEVKPNEYELLIPKGSKNLSLSRFRIDLKSE